MNLPTPDSIQTRMENNFPEMAESNPCMNCLAPCCRILLIPHKPPTTFLEMDYIRYMVGFENVEMVISSDGNWQVCIKEKCQLLDSKNNLCTVHNTPRKPKVCVYFNPHQCWYKRNFTTNNTQEILRIGMNAMEIILPYVKFDSDGNITEVPAWEKMKELVNNLHQVE